MRIVLFVCTGNSCRSVMGKAICEQLLRERGMLGGAPSSSIDPTQRVYVMSAGVSAVNGMSATFETRSVLRNIGLDISGHRSAHLTEDMIRHAELLLVMEEAHREDIVQKVPEAASKVCLLRTFGLEQQAAAGLDPTILDPIGKPLEVYEVCLATIREAVERVVQHLERSCASP